MLGKGICDIKKNKSFVV